MECREQGERKESPNASKSDETSRQKMEARGPARAPLSAYVTAVTTPWSGEAPNGPLSKRSGAVTRASRYRDSHGIRYIRPRLAFSLAPRSFHDTRRTSRSSASRSPRHHRISSLRGNSRKAAYRFHFDGVLSRYGRTLHAANSCEANERARHRIRAIEDLSAIKSCGIQSKRLRAKRRRGRH